MKHTLEQVYTREAELERAYEAAKAAGDEAGMEKARKEYQAMEKEVLETEDSDFGFAFRLYKQMKECGNEYIDLSIAIHDEVGTLQTLRKYGFEHFTFSSGWSSAVESAWIFQQNGCRLEGLIELNSIHKDWERLQTPGPHRTQQPSHELVYRNKGKGSRLPFQHPVKGGRG